MSTAVRIALLVLLLLAALGVLFRADIEEAWALRRAGGPLVSRGGGGPAVVLISLDTLRADHIGAYGYERPTTPTLDAFAEESIRFEQALSQATATLPSHLSMLTSLYPPQLGITRDDGENDEQWKTTLTLSEEVITLAEAFSVNGYRTAAFTDGGFLNARYGFDQGFDVYHANDYDVRGGSKHHSGMRMVIRKLAAHLRDVAAEWKAGDERPLFLFLHTYDPHNPYIAEEGFRTTFNPKGFDDFIQENGYAPEPGVLAERADEVTSEQAQWVRDLYDNGIRATDERVKQLFELLDDYGLYDGAVTVILSDHGEEFGDHGSFGHATSVYQELVHVPLLFRLPGGERGGAVVPHPNALVDVAPTLLELAGIAVPEQFEGRSLEGVLRGSDDGAWLASRPIYSDIANRRIGLHGLRKGSIKAMVTPSASKRELYDLTSDPLEKNDLSVERVDTMDALAAELDAWTRLMEVEAAEKGFIPETGAALENDHVEQLRALGYIE